MRKVKRLGKNILNHLIPSNPGNPSLWALLSRIVPRYHPKKANVGLHAIAKHSTCHRAVKHNCRKSFAGQWRVQGFVFCVFQGGAVAGQVACLFSMTQGKVEVIVHWFKWFCVHLHFHVSYFLWWVHVCPGTNNWVFFSTCGPAEGIVAQWSEPAC